MKKITILNIYGRKIGELSSIICKRASLLNLGEYDVYEDTLKVDFDTLREFQEEYKNKLKNTRKKQKKTIVKCWECQAEITNVAINRVPLCNKCQSSHNSYINDLKEKYRIVTNELMYEKAVEILCKQPKNIRIDKYKEAMFVIKEYIKENPTKFNSSYEVAVAIVLISLEVNIKIQPVIENYKGDFMLKEEHIIL